MPIYQYQCSHCDYTFENKENVHDKRKRKCPQCKKMKLGQIYSAPFVFSRSSISGSSGTLGTYAEANDKRVGKYKRTEIEGRKAEEIYQRRKKRGVKRPFWRKDRDKPNTKLATLDVAQKKSYIEDGKLPSGFDK